MKHCVLVASTGRTRPTSVCSIGRWVCEPYYKSGSSRSSRRLQPARVGYSPFHHSTVGRTPGGTLGGRARGSCAPISLPVKALTPAPLLPCLVAVTQPQRMLWLMPARRQALHMGPCALCSRHVLNNVYHWRLPGEWGRKMFARSQVRVACEASYYVCCLNTSSEQHHCVVSPVNACNHSCISYMRVGHTIVLPAQPCWG